MRGLYSILLISFVGLIVGALAGTPVTVNTPFGDVTGVATEAAHSFKVRILAILPVFSCFLSSLGPPRGRNSLLCRKRLYSTILVFNLR